MPTYYASIPRKLVITALVNIPDNRTALYGCSAITDFGGEDTVYQFEDPGGSTAGRFSVRDYSDDGLLIPAAISTVGTTVSAGTSTTFYFSPSTDHLAQGLVFYLNLPQIDAVRYDLYDDNDFLIFSSTNHTIGDSNEQADIIGPFLEPPTAADFWTRFNGTYEIA